MPARLGGCQSPRLGPALPFRPVATDCGETGDRASDEPANRVEFSVPARPGRPGSCPKFGRFVTIMPSSPIDPVIAIRAHVVRVLNVPGVPGRRQEQRIPLPGGHPPNRGTGRQYDVSRGHEQSSPDCRPPGLALLLAGHRARRLCGGQWPSNGRSGRTAQALQSGPIHTSVPVDTPSARPRLMPSELTPAATLSRLPAAEPVPTELPATQSSAGVIPTSLLQPLQRRELWAPDFVTTQPAADRIGAAMHTVQLPGRRVLPVPEEVTGRPNGGNGGAIPFDDDIKPLVATRTNLQPPPGEMPMDYAERSSKPSCPLSAAARTIGGRRTWSTFTKRRRSVFSRSTSRT